jgi:glycosyltransferase involved in cell wall biosynthesis
MTERPLRILQVSTYDTIGGAEKVAWNLFQTYRARGYGSWLAVGHKLGNDPDVWVIPNHGLDGRWARFWRGLHSRLQSREGQAQGLSWLGSLVHTLAEPGRALDHYRGVEDFRFPGTWQLLEPARQRPDIIHCHNLHGGYFDLRALPWLSQQVPVVATLHDAWLLSGHCAHSLGCERWKMGCGHCPDLTIDPPIQRDATAYNWQRKRDIYTNSRLYIATPSRWLMHKVEQSMLAASVVEARIIPNGVDLSIFHPADKRAVRAALDIPQGAKVLLFAATAVRENTWKDYRTLRMAVDRVVEHLHGYKVLFIALGEDAPAEHVGQAEVRFVPFQKDPEAVAQYFQAADVYAHAARADTFPNTVLEALACGAPVVATAVGGIPEQIDDGRTGFLVPAGDVEALASRLVQVLSDDALRQRMGIQAAKVARRRFDLRRQVDAYLEWYAKLVSGGAPLTRGQEVACVARP